MSQLLILAEAHGANKSFWQDFTSVLLDPAHILSELVFSVVFDVLVGYLIWGLLIRRVLIPRLRRDIHREVDEEQHIEHTADGGHIHLTHGED